MGLTVSDPGDLPVSLTEIKAHLRIDDSDDDTMLNGLAEAATESAQSFLRRQLIQTTCVLTLDAWPTRFIELPRPPLVSVTSVQYVDTDGATQTWGSSNYDVIIDQSPGRIVPAFGIDWPSIRDHEQAITVTYVAGYGADETAVPWDLKAAILMTIATWYENREGVVVGTIATPLPHGVQRLLWGKRSLGMT